MATLNFSWQSDGVALGNVPGDIKLPIDGLQIEIVVRLLYIADTNCEYFINM